MIELILGTAGHIDHGKTALVRALTGTDTDRLPEEKRRGITIELGFAELVLDDIRLGIVDVPGHERFVRQMLAGATGMDLAMLVVAADDSVKPQTREHMDVLRMLDLSRGVIVLTKCDLADPDWIDLVEQETRELVAGSFLESAAIIRTSAVAGTGLDELRSELSSLALRVHEQQESRWSNIPFRMAVDRAFSLTGHGTIVTGSVASGRISVGDSLELQPAGVTVRVRGLHNHDRTVDEVHRGQRAAINLAGVNLHDLQRGFELVAPGYLRPSRSFLVWIHALPGNPWPLKDRSRVRVHLGTTATAATLRLFDSPTLPPGAAGLAQLILGGQAACLWNQPLVIRSESPLLTIGGGRVLVPVANRLRHLEDVDRHHLQRLMCPSLAEDDGSGPSDVQRLASAIYFAPTGTWRPADSFRLAGLSYDPALLKAGVSSGELVELHPAAGRGVVLHVDTLRAKGHVLQKRLTRLHDAQPLLSLFESSAVTSGVAYLGDEALLREILRWLHDQGAIRMSHQRIGLADRQPKLSATQRRLLDELVHRVEQAGWEPPSVGELKREYPKQAKELTKLLECAVSDGLLVRAAKDFFLHLTAEQKLRDVVGQAFADKPQMTVSDIRELLGTSRKYAVPWCEYLDQIGFTRRNGDVRVLANEKT